jgi:hypothetical protein
MPSPARVDLLGSVGSELLAACCDVVCMQLFRWALEELGKLPLATAEGLIRLQTGGYLA